MGVPGDEANEPYGFSEGSPAQMIFITTSYYMVQVLIYVRLVR